MDTDYAGTLPAFYRAIKHARVKASDVSYVLATHYHPDHMGLIPELMKQGVKLLLIDTQVDSVHFSDYIFARDRVPFEPIDEAKAAVITCAESKEFLAGIGISGEITQEAQKRRLRARSALTGQNNEKTRIMHEIMHICMKCKIFSHKNAKKD